MPKPAPRVVLFLGSDNRHRSRIAEVLFNGVAGKFGLAWQGKSRGLAISPPGPALTPTAAKALQFKGARGDVLTRAPIAVTADDGTADRIVALNQAEHEPLIREQFPDWAERVEYWTIDAKGDPTAAIDREVARLVSRLLGGSGEPIPENEPAPPAAPPTNGGKPRTAKVSRETKGRKGKTVTLVTELDLKDAELTELAGKLKAKCGTGGTVKDGQIEIQGDHRERIVEELQKLGFNAKRAGG